MYCKAHKTTDATLMKAFSLTCHSWSLTWLKVTTGAISNWNRQRK